MPFSPYTTLTTEIVQGLVQARIPEDRTLDYKRDLPSTADELRKKLVVPVSAFANTAGGVLVYGIEEQQDADGKNTGIPDRVYGIGNVSVDEVKRRFEEVLARSIKPRVPGIDIYEVQCGDGVSVVVVQIPRSWASPHSIQKPGDDTWVSYYRRRNASNLAMDWQEIRSSILESEGQRERIERFRNDRIGKIATNSVGWPLAGFARLILHIVPLGSIGGEAIVDVAKAREHGNDIEPIYFSGLPGYAFEGLLSNAILSETGESQSYTLLFREGIIEAVFNEFAFNEGDGPAIPIKLYSHHLVERIPSYLRAVTRWGAAPPFLLMLAATGVRGARFDLGVRVPSRRNENRRIHHDTLVFPPVVLNSVDVPIEEAFKPALDALWNAAGFPRSFSYDENGAWIADNDC